MEGLIFAAPLLMLVVMGLLAAIGLPGSRRSWEAPPAQPTPQPQPRAVPLPAPPAGWRYAMGADGRPALVPAGGAR